MRTLPSSPSTLTAILTLRPNGEPKLVRMVNIAQYYLMSRHRASHGRSERDSSSVRARRKKSAPARKRSAGDHEVHGLRAFAFLVGLNVEGDALSFVQLFEPGSLDGGDVHEHITRPVIRLDEAVATLGIEELDRTCISHRETPIPMVDPPPAPTARRL